MTLNGRIRRSYSSLGAVGESDWQGFWEVVKEVEAVQAERRVVEGLKRLGWSEADLKARRKGEPRKVDLVLKSAFSLQSFSVSDMLPTRKQ